MITLGKILAALALVAAICFGLWRAEQHVEGIGYQHGEAAQKATDQIQFDRIEAERTEQKAKAAELLAKANADVIAGLAREDQFKTQLEKAREINRNEVNDLARKYAGKQLRFATTASAQGAGCGAGGAGTAGTQANPAGADATTVIQLPDPVTADLRQLVVDADNLKVEYVACYAYVNRDELRTNPPD